MDDQTDSDVENGFVPPTLPNLLTLADQQGDDDEETIGGLSDGDHDDGDDGDNIGTLSEEKNPGIRTETPHEEKNPSHPIDNKFFYISQSNAIVPKHGYNIPSLRNIAEGVIYDTGNIHILLDLFNDPEGPTMRSIRTGPTSYSLALCLVAAIVEALHQTRGSIIIYSLKSIVDDLAKRLHTTVCQDDCLELLKTFVGNLITFITEKPEELQVSITLIRDSVSRLSTEEEQQPRPARPPRRSRSLQEEEEHVDGKDRYLADFTKAYKESPIRSWQANQAEQAKEKAKANAEADEDRKLKKLAKFQAKETAKAFTKALHQGGSPPGQDSDSDEEDESSGRN